jgi:hypothetical protein
MAQPNALAAFVRELVTCVLCVCMCVCMLRACIMLCVLHVLCMHVCIRVLCTLLCVLCVLCVCVRMCVCVCVCVCICVRECNRIMCACIYVWRYLRVYIHICFICTCMHFSLVLPSEVIITVCPLVNGHVEKPLPLEALMAVTQRWPGSLK